MFRRARSQGRTVPRSRMTRRVSAILLVGGTAIKPRMLCISSEVLLHRIRDAVKLNGDGSALRRCTAQGEDHVTAPPRQDRQPSQKRVIPACQARREAARSQHPAGHPQQLVAAPLQRWKDFAQETKVSPAQGLLVRRPPLTGVGKAPARLIGSRFFSDAGRPEVRYVRPQVLFFAFDFEAPFARMRFIAASSSLCSRLASL